MQKIADNIFQYTTAGGLSCLLEPLTHLVSTAVVIASPLGAAYDTSRYSGAAGVISEWLFRGSGGKTGREIASELDFLGCHRDESVRSEAMFFSTTQAKQALNDTLSVYADILQRPNLADDTFAACLELGRQELIALEDQPSRKCADILRSVFFGDVLGASSYGSQAGLAALTSDYCRQHARAQLSGKSSILAISGNFDLEKITDILDERFGQWTGDEISLAAPAARTPRQEFIEKDSAQYQIGLAWDAPVVTSSDYYPARLAEMILCGGMSGRLFTEVREKRGLVYSISTTYRANSKTAGLFVYAGTAPDRAQQTLDVTVEQLKLLAAGVTDEELERAKTQLKSALIMQGERTTIRAAALTSDYLRMGRVRTLDELAAEIDAVTLDQVNSYLKSNTASDFAAVIMGPKPLETAALN